MNIRHLTGKAGLLRPSLLFTLTAIAACSPVTDPVELADPFVGTGGTGHTYPGASAPFGMVQLSADTHNTGWDACAGYRDGDRTILGFSHTHLSGTGGIDMGDFLFTPAIGNVDTTDGHFSIAPMPFSKDDETAQPGYYRVDFPRQGITAELTATPHTGCHRYTFRGDGERHLLIDMRYNIGDTHPDSIRFAAPDNQTINGGRHVEGWARHRWMYFSAHFSVPFTDCQTDSADRYLLTFPADVSEVTVSIGLSPIDEAGAENNRMAEAPVCNFDTIRQASHDSWEEYLGKIRVEGGTKTQRELFYTALYHTMIAPNLMSDVDGRYRNHRQEVAQAPDGRRYYSTLSLWDTFRTWNPLQTLINHNLVSDMVFSLMSMYDCDGKLPLWPLAGADTDCMIGYHATAVIADAWLRGIRTFDGEKALQAMITSSNADIATPWYTRYGYIPCDLSPQSISKTLEFAYDDWCIARMAESLGHDDIAAEYDRRARFYQNIFDPTSGFFRGKDSEGNWRMPFDPTGSSRDYTEATAWHYRFFVPHDMAGLRSLMGGAEATRAALDSLFAYDYDNPDMEDGNISGVIGQYAHGNEPSHASAWLFPWAGSPADTQQRVRQILDTQYTMAPDGLCGNEDCGQMSAWYVMAAIGLYPACPGSGEFIFAAPLFKKVTITTATGATLVITADHPEHTYIKAVTFNGKPVDTQFITYDELMKGGELAFTLSPTANQPRLANSQEPYSLTTATLVSTPCLDGNPRFFEDTFTVDLHSRTAGAQIYYTLDGTEPTEQATRYEQPFTVSSECNIRARAFKEGCEPSPLMCAHLFPIDYLPAVTADGRQPGCRYTYHRGAFMTTAQVAASPVVSSGIMPEPDISGATDADHFGYIFTGYLDVPEDGLWEFAVTSDDGSVLELDGRLAVNNDGSHANYTATGHIALRKGLHAFRLLYLEDYEGQHLDWKWRAPSATTFSPIPAGAVSHR